MFRCCRSPVKVLTMVLIVVCLASMYSFFSRARPEGALFRYAPDTQKSPVPLGTSHPSGTDQNLRTMKQALRTLSNLQRTATSTTEKNSTSTFEMEELIKTKLTDDRRLADTMQSTKNTNEGKYVTEGKQNYTTNKEEEKSATDSHRVLKATRQGKDTKTQITIETKRKQTTWSAADNTAIKPTQGSSNATSVTSSGDKGMKQTMDALSQGQRRLTLMKSLQRLSASTLLTTPALPMSNVLTTSNTSTVRPPTAEEQQVFRQRVTDDQAQIFSKLLDAFNDTLTSANIPSFLYGGTLIGSWRHHGLIPWDDDVDMVVPDQRKPEIETLLRSLGPDFHLKVREKHSWKFYHKLSKKAGVQSWSWPFVDLCFYKENSTHIWDPDPFFPDFVFSKDFVFPLTKRPFLGKMLPAPRDTKTFLKQTYDVDKCLVGHYDHTKEMARNESERGNPVDCRVLHSIHPFVHRVYVDGKGCNETLVKDGAVTSWFLAANTTC